MAENVHLGWGGPLRGGWWVWWYGGVSTQREQRVCNRSLLIPAGLSQRNLPEGCAGAMQTATNTQT